ncbi:MAG: serine/threonine protein kinase [Bradymonadaceae bacterium]|nr:serine/threonine protein kinase [Lujinxingiaceae bacterium]
MIDVPNIETFRIKLETLGFDGPTLNLPADHSMLLKDCASSAQREALHTLPELSFEGAQASAVAPDLRAIRTLGTGGMGLVRLANQLSLDREVAVKTTRDASNEAAAAALLQEAYVTGYLEHPNIVPIYTVGRTADGAPLIVMKRVEGTSWLEKLGRLTLVEHVEILIDVCNAVRFAHSRGVIHRDIKLENVMIGNFDEVYLLDWGIALSLDESKPLLPHRSKAQGVFGTPQYMAPEMAIQAIAELDERTDVYLLGATLHHILTGAPRHGGPTILAILFAAHCSAPYDYLDAVPAELAAIAQKACQRDKAQRYQSVDAFRAALDEYLRHRDSIALSSSAEIKRVEFEALLEQPVPDLLAIHDTYGECRFGFYQALRMWPQNRLATDGLQRSLEAMAEHYLRQASLDAARACIAELPEPRPELAARAEALARRLEVAQANLERLETLEKNLDLGVGRGSRTRLILLLGAFWTGTSFYAATHELLYGMINSEALQKNMIAGFRNVAIVAVAMFVLRQRILANVANQRLIYSLASAMVAVSFIRWAAWFLQVNVGYAYAVDTAIYACALVAAGLMSDRRISWLAGCYGSAGMIGVLWPSAQLFAYAVATTLTCAGLAWIWRPSASAEAKAPKDAASIDRQDAR